MKEPHTALFVAPTGVGKTHLALSLLETEYRNHFDFIVIICPTLRYNSTYKNKTNDLILNLTPENVTQHSRIVTTTRKGSSTPTKMSKIIGRQIH